MKLMPGMVIIPQGADVRWLVVAEIGPFTVRASTGELVPAAADFDNVALLVWYTDETPGQFRSGWLRQEATGEDWTIL